MRAVKSNAEPRLFLCVSLSLSFFLSPLLTIKYCLLFDLPPLVPLQIPPPPSPPTPPPSPSPPPAFPSLPQLIPSHSPVPPPRLPTYITSHPASSTPTLSSTSSSSTSLPRRFPCACHCRLFATHLFHLRINQLHPAHLHSGHHSSIFQQIL